MAKVKLYDTTLRDGAQTEGLTFSLEDKLKITSALDRLGIDYIEGGWPGSNPKDLEYFNKVKGRKLKNARVVAFGSTRRKNVEPEDDKNLNALVEAETSAVCIFGKSWDVHVTSVLVTTLDENLKMISGSISWLKSKKLEVIFDAEHFFDGFKDNREYAIQTIVTAEEAGADVIVLCDTNGGTLPNEVREVIGDVKARLKTPLGIHAHNDSDCAVANSVVAVEEGVVQVQGTMNSYGERCGNANLASIIPNLMLKMGINVVGRKKLSLLTQISHQISEIANMSPNTHQPYVGESAFAHKGGVHVSGILRQKGAYEHVDPQAVGNVQRVLISELSGVKTVIEKAKELGINLKDKEEHAADILKKLKKKEHEGYHYEAADSSFALFVMKNTGAYRPLFDLESFRVEVDRWHAKKLSSEATVKLKVKGRRVVEMAEGHGPVNALDSALRKALEPAYPELSKIKLSDYRVRVLDEKKGTAARVRVLIESTDGKRSWGTVGVSEDIIEASWEALVESIEYGLLRKPAFRRRLQRRTPK